MVHSGIKNTQWPFYLQEIYRILKPNYGWAQIMEAAFPPYASDNNSLSEDAPLNKVSFSRSNNNFPRSLNTWMNIIGRDKE